MAKNELAPILEEQPTLIQSVRTHVTELLEKNSSTQYAFHDLGRALEVARDAQKIAAAAELNETDTEIVIIAAWFLFSGFSEGQPAVREKSLSIAKRFLTSCQYPANKLDQVLGCIRAAQEPSGQLQTPTTPLEEVLSDASIVFLAKKKFWRRVDYLRLELESLQGNSYSDCDWLGVLMERYNTTRFHTDAAEKLYGEQRAKNLREVTRELDEHDAQSDVSTEKARNLGKGMDTLFRTQSRTLTNLVSMADRKAQMMINVNAITISILMSTLLEQISEHPKLIIPAVILITVNLITITFAILAVRPVTQKASKVTHDDVVLKHGYLMTQVIFNDIAYEDFRLGIKRMMQDEDHIYDTLIQGLYGTGRVLQKKFRLLAWSYTTFIWGFALAAVSFGIIAVTQ